MQYWRSRLSSHYAARRRAYSLTAAGTAGRPYRRRPTRDRAHQAGVRRRAVVTGVHRQPAVDTLLNRVETCRYRGRIPRRRCSSIAPPSSHVARRSKVRRTRIWYGVAPVITPVGRQAITRNLTMLEGLARQPFGQCWVRFRHPTVRHISSARRSIRPTSNGISRRRGTPPRRPGWRPSVISRQRHLAMPVRRPPVRRAARASSG